MENSSIDKRLNAMRPSDAIEISRINEHLFCTAELSGDGKTLLFVRHNGDVHTVFNTIKYE